MGCASSQQPQHSAPHSNDKSKGSQKARIQVCENPKVHNQLVFNSTAELGSFLMKYGVNLEEFGTGSNKTLAQLLSELQTSACSLQVKKCDPPKVVRIVEPVFIILFWKGCVLVQESQEMPDGRWKSQKTLLAEKKEAQDKGGVFSAALRGIHEELLIPLSHLQEDGVLSVKPDGYSFEIEEIDSVSYPGLPCYYQTHYVQVDILESGLPKFAHCGLPALTDFSTKESTTLGEITHLWSWYPLQRVIKEGISKLPPELLSHSPMMTSLPNVGYETREEWKEMSSKEFSDAKALSALLVRARLDVTKFGEGMAKTVTDLLQEVRSGESVLKWFPESRKLQRIAEPVFLQLRWGDRVCVEVKQVLESGRARQRNMLLARKKSPNDADICATALRAIHEQLNVPLECLVLDKTVSFRKALYCCIAENLESISYPGLPCLYITHYCCVQISALDVFSKLGILKDDPFEMKEMSGKINHFSWKPFEEAAYGDVKGFPRFGRQPQEKGPKYELVNFDSLNVPNLQTILERGGVNVNGWGIDKSSVLHGLLRELTVGSALLEKDTQSGKVRRVRPSVSLQVTRRRSSTGSTEIEEQMFPEGLRSSFAQSVIAEDLRYRADQACFEVHHVDVSSYPGLPSVLQTRRVQVDDQFSQCA